METKEMIINGKKVTVNVPEAWLEATQSRKIKKEEDKIMYEYLKDLHFNGG